jgi:hypothetical protein
MIETLLTNESISRGSGVDGGFIIAKQSIRQLVVPLFTKRLDGLRSA